MVAWTQVVLVITYLSRQDRHGRIQAPCPLFSFRCHRHRPTSLTTGWHRAMEVLVPRPRRYHALGLHLLPPLPLNRALRLPFRAHLRLDLHCRLWNHAAFQPVRFEDRRVLRHRLLAPRLRLLHAPPFLLPRSREIPLLFYLRHRHRAAWFRCSLTTSNYGTSLDSSAI